MANHQHAILLPQALNLAVADDVAIEEGEEAAGRLVRGQSLTDQLKVARALMVGRRAALAESGANHPEGKPYFVAFNRWLARHPKLAAILPDNRAAGLWCVEPENWPKVQAALERLTDQERQRATLRGLRKRIEPKPAPSPRRAARPASAQEPGQDKAEDIAAALDKLRREHAKAIEELKAAHAKAIGEERRFAVGEFYRGVEAGMKNANSVVIEENRRLKGKLHEDVVAKLAERFTARGETKPTEQDVANAAMGKWPKFDRVKMPLFTEREIAQLRKALHPDGKPPALQKVFTDASALFNDRAEKLVKSAKRGR